MRRLYKEHMALGDLAEPLGFDSWSVILPGTSMSPAPLQLLSYMPGGPAHHTGDMRDRVALG
jgi:hypothetical protein